jgi:hypothetical protein
MSGIEDLMITPYVQCKMTDDCAKFQFCPPAADLDGGALPPGCAYAAKIRQLGGLPAAEEEEKKSVGGLQCFQLNGDNLAINKLAPPESQFDIPDVQLLIQPPVGACDPCEVSYAVSARLRDDQYVAIGFKGESWEGEIVPGQPLGGHPPQRRPCYFGMCVDEYDNFTSDRIALGYATSSHGACVREMVSKDVVGEPSDAALKILSGTAVQRRGNRTVMKFTVPQHWPKKTALDGFFRVMCAHARR